MPTIFAPINNFRNSAVCVVRISGCDIFNMRRFIPVLSDIKPRIATLAKVYDLDGSVLDEAVIVYFKAPKSFTGEDVLEVSLHASAFVVSRFLALLGSLQNFVFAKAGEFCLRAVQNEKITLAKAEAINKLILSESAVQHRFAMAEFEGVLGDYYKNIKENLMQVLMLLEAYIDFSEDEAISMDFAARIKGIVGNVVQTLQKTLMFSKKKDDHDVSIAIVGRPNVGKSTLFNYLTNTNDAIVSQIAGTTRDAIRKNVIIGDFKVQIIDTAGIRTSTDEIEQIGIERAIEIARTADVILYLHNEIGTLEIKDYQGEVIHVWTKSDISNAPKDMIGIAVINNDIASLELALSDVFKKKLDGMQAAGFLCNERQKVVLQGSIDILNSINFDDEAEIVSEKIRQAMHSISHIIGVVGTEDILGEIFSNFCIGK
jgi:tRNA modification GTPase